VLHDEELGKGDMKGLNDYPRLAKLAEAVRNRPNVKTFLNSPEYKG
jgi:prostaglandin-H2 D-isomerase / glutathione transferase